MHCKLHYAHLNNEAFFFFCNVMFIIFYNFLTSSSQISTCIARHGYICVYVGVFMSAKPVVSLWKEMYPEMRNSLRCSMHPDAPDFITAMTPTPYPSWFICLGKGCNHRRCPTICVHFADDLSFIFYFDCVVKDDAFSMKLVTPAKISVHYDVLFSYFCWSSNR